MKNFKFYYRCLDNDYSVHIRAENLNKAMMLFTKYYHEIDEIYSIKEEIV